jgi:hypothetical protein
MGDDLTSMLAPDLNIPLASSLLSSKVLAPSWSYLPSKRRCIL